MGVDVVLAEVSQLRTSSKRRRVTSLEVLSDRYEAFVRICARSSLPMLRRVNPYGDLILTPAEVPQFIAEIDEELVAADAAPEREFLNSARRLALRCAGDPSTELHLVGDEMKGIC